jgi:hypothetical protein
MKCRDALRALLEAEPLELRGEGESAVAAHVRECPGCRRAAGVLLAGGESLADSLRDLAPPLDVATVLERAQAADEDKAGLPFPGPARRGWRGIGWKSALPLAAAATAAFLLITRNDGPLPVAPVTESSAITMAQVLEAPEGKNVAVLETQNPAIAVVWFF